MVNRDYEYMVSDGNGGIVHVPTTDDLCKMIKMKLDNLFELNDKLRRENKQLKDEHYKDTEIQRLKEENNRLHERLIRGFGISEEEHEAIKAWIAKHEFEHHGILTDEDSLRFHGACGGAYKYVFVPTSIGVIGEVQCTCGEKFIFQDLG